MHQRKGVKNKTTIWLLLLIVGGAISHTAVAKKTIVNTPVNQSDYEFSLQGLVQVNATVFNAPCNLQFKEMLVLTGCGAGNAYHKMNISSVDANTPIRVRLRFYDVRQRTTLARYPLSLSHGSNAIQIPALMKNKSAFRVEVSYE